MEAERAGSLPLCFFIKIRKRGDTSVSWSDLLCLPHSHLKTRESKSDETCPQAALSADHFSLWASLTALGLLSSSDCVWPGSLCSQPGRPRTYGKAHCCFHTPPPTPGPALPGLASPRPQWGAVVWTSALLIVPWVCSVTWSTFWLRE